MNEESKQNEPSIEPAINGPYLVNNLKDLKDSKGEQLNAKPVMALCRCGGSSSKPFCDGTHLNIGFKGDKDPSRNPDKLDTYEGKDITIHDNRGVCAHAGFCTDNSPNIFNVENEPWISPDADDAGKTARTIRMCPSGALSYTRDGVLYKDLGRSPSLTVSKDGPYYVTGGVKFNDSDGNTPESKEHYTLCRCGASKNKPFCNGDHWQIKFKDPKN